MTPTDKAAKLRSLPLVLLGLSALLVILGVIAMERYGSHLPVPSGQRPQLAVRVGLAPTEPSTPAAQPPLDTTNAKSLALLHQKLNQWLASEADDGRDQPQLLQELLDSLTNDNVAIVTQSLSAAELKSDFGMVALARWLTVDPSRAAQWMATRSDTSETQARLVAGKLLETPGELQEYCSRLPDTEWKKNILIGAGLSLLQRDPVEAINLAQQLSPGAARNNLLQSVAYEWARADLRASLNWIKDVQDPTLHDQLMAASARAIAINDPDLAADWLVSAVKSREVFYDTLPNIVENWAAQDPATVAEWVTGVPAGEVREPVLEIVGRNWLQSNPRAAARWIRSLPESRKILADLNIN